MSDLETVDVEIKVGKVGLVLTLSQSNWRISRRKDKMEEEARLNPLPDPDDQLFASSFYPLLAGAVISDNCPTLNDCLENISEDDLEKWYKASKEINPSWFEFMNAISELMRQQESSDMETKKEPALSLIDDERIQEE